MTRWLIAGSRLNGRDGWVFEADSYEVEDNLIRAEGSFARKRSKTTIRVPMTSVIYIEELPQAVGERGSVRHRRVMRPTAERRTAGKRSRNF